MLAGFGRVWDVLFLKLFKKWFKKKTGKNIAGLIQDLYNVSSVLEVLDQYLFTFQCEALVLFFTRLI